MSFRVHGKISVFHTYSNGLATREFLSDSTLRAPIDKF